MVQTICVCGAGTMGSGIAQVAAQSGLTTILYEPNLPVLEKAATRMEKSLQALIDKGKLSHTEKENILHRLHYSNNPEHCKAGIIIEAIIEKLETKIDLFNQLAGINSPGTVLASNTSSLSINAIAERLKNPERFIGMHFFNPAPVMKLVEVVKANATSEATTAMITGLAKQMGKTAVICKDSPGFIVNRVARPYYIEALRLAEEAASDFRQTDALLEATGFKMGPFKLMDLIGNDINYAVSCSVYEQLNKPERLRPSDIQKDKVANGALGKKTGKGYYDYP